MNRTRNRRYGRHGTMAPLVLAAVVLLGLVTPPAQADEDGRVGSPKIDATPTAARQSTRVKTAAPVKKTAKTTRTMKKVKKSARKSATVATEPPPPVEAPAPAPIYTCAGLSGTTFEPLFGSEVFFQGPDTNFECGLSDNSYVHFVGVLKRDMRTFTYFTRDAGELQENFGRDSVSFARRDGHSGFQISIFLTGGRLLVARAPTLASARVMATAIELSWPVLSLQQKIDVSFGECPGITRKALGRDLAPLFNDVAAPSDATNVGTDTSPDLKCTLATEGGDLRVIFFGSNLVDPTFPWNVKGWRPLTPLSAEYEDFGIGVYTVALQTSTLGFVQIRGRSNTNSAVGGARKWTYQAQQARIRALAPAIAKL